MWSWCTLRNFHADPWEATLDVHKKLGLPLKPPYSETLKHGKYLEKQLCEQGAGYWERFVAGVYGPVVVDFLSWIAHTVKKEGEAPVYFLSRDGYVFYKVLEGGKDERLHSYIRSYDYLYISRISLELAYWAITNEPGRFINAIIRRGQRYTNGWASLQALNRILPQNVLERMDLQPNVITCREFKRIVTARWPRVQAGFVEQMELYRQYLAKSGVFNQPVIYTVDLVGRGSNQLWLERFFRYWGKETKVRGLYLKHFGSFFKEYKSLTSYSFSAAEDSAFLNSLLVRFVWPLETLFSAPHGRFIGLHRDGRPQFQRGTLREHYDMLVELTLKYWYRLTLNFDFAYREGFHSALINLLGVFAYPTKEDVEQIGGLRFQVGQLESEFTLGGVNVYKGKLQPSSLWRWYSLYEDTDTGNTINGRLRNVQRKVGLFLDTLSDMIKSVVVIVKNFVANLWC